MQPSKKPQELINELPLSYLTIKGALFIVFHRQERVLLFISFVLFHVKLQFPVISKPTFSLLFSSLLQMYPDGPWLCLLEVFHAS